MMGSYSRHHW